MTITVGTPGVDGLGEVLLALREWQDDTSSLQLHPGDLGWAWQFGADATAAAVRVWRRDGHVVAVGFLDSPDVFRLTVAPRVRLDDDVAHHVVADLADPGAGVLPAGKASVEAPNGTLVQQRLTDAGWYPGEAWTPLRRDLRGPVAAPGVRIEVVGPEQVSTYTAVHRSAFGSARFTDALWHTMASGPPFADARSLLAYDDRDVAVAAVTVWSAGRSRPGLIEPMGVHADHRGHGHGRAICLAAAAALQRLGSSSVLVCTPSNRTAAVATYESAGLTRLPERLDRSRDR